MNRQIAGHVLILCSLIVSIPAWAQQQEEKLTITTYYPSPTGVYNQLQAKRVVIGDVNGDGQLNSADVPANARPLYVQDNSTSGYTAAFVNRDGYGLALGASYTATYAAIQSNTFVNGGGAASPSVTNLSINPDGGNVSIGTSISSAKLRVDTSANNDGIALVNDPYWLKIMSGTVHDGSYNYIVRAHDSALIYTNGTLGTGSFVIAPWAEATSGLKMDADGRVGIKTTFPEAQLHVTTTAGNNGANGLSDFGMVTTAMSGQATLGAEFQGDGYANLNLGQNQTGTRRFWHISSRLSSSPNPYSLAIYNYNGTAFNRYVDVTATGQVTKPAQVAFVARISSGSITPPNYIKWNNVLTNIGSCYNSATGLFTAPVSGMYMFGFNILIPNPDVGDTRYSFYKNGAHWNCAIYTKDADEADTWHTIQLTELVHLQEGDTFGVYCWTADPSPSIVYTDANYNRFWGYFLG